MSRDVAGDKWDSCRAIDCAQRTDRLVLMRFVVLPPAPPARATCHEAIRISRRSPPLARQLHPHKRLGGHRWILVLAIPESRGITRTGDFATDVVPTAAGILSPRERSALSRISPWYTRVVLRAGGLSFLGEKSLVEPRCIGEIEKTLLSLRKVLVLLYSIFRFSLIFRAPPLSRDTKGERDGDCGTARGSCRYSVLVSVCYPLQHPETV